MASTMASGRADFVCDTAGDVMMIRVRGEIDHHTAVSVRGGMDAILFEKRPRRLILDLSAVGFMDSSGLGLIMGRFSVMKELGGELIVANPSREIRGILTLAGMERMVRIEYADDEESQGSASPMAGQASSSAERERASGTRSRARAGTPRSRKAAATAGEALSSIEVVGRRTSSRSGGRAPSKAKQEQENKGKE